MLHVHQLGLLSVKDFNYLSYWHSQYCGRLWTPVELVALQTTTMRHSRRVQTFAEDTSVRGPWRFVTFFQLRALWCQVWYCCVTALGKLITPCAIVTKHHNLVVMVWSHWSSHKWTGSGTSVIWTWLNWMESGTWYPPALDCYSLTFWRWKYRIHALAVWWCKIFTRL